MLYSKLLPVFAAINPLMDVSTPHFSILSAKAIANFSPHLSASALSFSAFLVLYLYQASFALITFRSAIEIDVLFFIATKTFFQSMSELIESATLIYGYMSSL